MNIFDQDTTVKCMHAVEAIVAEDCFFVVVAIRASDGYAQVISSIPDSPATLPGVLRELAKVVLDQGPEAKMFGDGYDS
jgi:hypothetical protein